MMNNSGLIDLNSAEVRNARLTFILLFCVSDPPLLRSVTLSDDTNEQK